ncbi:hypothetical protein HY409_01410 [Candidatus Gottesmanbacteria bacterium]|nr:hypothetical protein [Candidatus Gottesmanbacteria bacterium]
MLWMYIGIAIGVLAPLMLPLAQPGTLHQFDTILHLERIVAFYRALGDHNIPPTWSTYLSYGFGSPVLIYNWSFPYYIASFFLSLGSTLVDAYKWMTALAYILAFIWMFVWIASFTKFKIAALVAAAWYVWAPYRFNINQLRGAMGEEFATAFWPGVFWATTITFNKRYTLGFFAGTLLWSLMVWSHPPMFAMILPLWLLYTGIQFLQTRDIRAALISLSTLLVGMGSVAYSWAPIIFERRFLYYGVYEAIYPDNFVRWTQLLAQPDIYEFGLQLGPTRYLVFYSIGWALIATGILTVYSLASLRQKWAGIHIYQLLFLCMGLFGVFLLRPASSYLWAHLPLLAPTMVFPQRFLGLVMFCGSTLAGLYISRMHPRHTWTVAMLSIACIMLMNYPYFTLNKNREPNLDRLNAPVLTTTDVWGEFSPKWIPSDFAQRGLDYAKQPLTTPQYPCQQTSTTIRCQVNTNSAGTIRFRQFYFPGWIAYADDQEIPVMKNADGTIGLTLTHPTQTVRIVFSQTPVRQCSLFLSMIVTSLFVCFGGKTVYTHIKNKIINL